MTSKQTIFAVVKILMDWAKAKGIELIDVHELLNQLEGVEGNSSFRSSMAAILTLFKREVLVETFAPRPK